TPVMKKACPTPRSLRAGLVLAATVHPGVRFPVFLFVVLLLGALMAPPARAQQFEDFTYTSDGSAIIITGYTGAGGEVAIPDIIEELPVRSIGTRAFMLKTTLTNVTIPDSVISIGERAFFGCR